MGRKRKNVKKKYDRETRERSEQPLARQSASFQARPVPLVAGECLTCGNVMSQVGPPGRDMRHCHRCGTFEFEGNRVIPQVIERCREFLLDSGPDIHSEKFWGPISECLYR